MNIDCIVDNSFATHSMIQQHLEHFLWVSYTPCMKHSSLCKSLPTHPRLPFHLSFKTIHKLLRHSERVINHCCSFILVLFL
jgi:hypothetical protein